MNVVDLILVAILACVTLHFYFRKKKKALSSGKEKEKPIREAVRKEGQERACPVICVVFQPELEEEELAAEIADMYLHGRAYYYSGKPLPEQPKEEPISIKYKDVQWERLKNDSCLIKNRNKMKAIENVREKANQVINRYGKVIFTFLIFFTLLGTAQVAEAQSGLKINSLSEVTDKAKEGADTILDVAKYILAAVLGIALVFVIYSLATNNPHAKEYLLGWIIAVVVIMVAFLII